MMDLIDHVEAILKCFDIEPKPLDHLLKYYLERHSGISSDMRREIADAVFGIMRFKRRIEGVLILRGVNRPTKRQIVEGYLGTSKNVIPTKVGIQETSKTLDSGFRRNDECEVFRDAHLSLADLGKENFPGGPAGYHSFPDFIYEMIEKDFGTDGAARLASSLNQPASTVLRVNTLAADLKSVLERLHQGGIKAGPGELSPFAVILDSRISLSRLDLWREGAIDVQDESSQVSVIAADPKPGDLILDACAGAGGKSIMMAMLMQNKGRIIAADTQKDKLSKLKKRAARTGVGIIETCETGLLKNKMSHLKGKFDLVYIDAPCSGTGTIRRNPDLKWRLTREMIEENVKLERSLFEEYSSWARSGGRVVYATCSVLTLENESVIADHRELGLKKSGEYLRTDPCRYNCDGFFTAMFEKKSLAINEWIC